MQDWDLHATLGIRRALMLIIYHLQQEAATLEGLKLAGTTVSCLSPFDSVSDLKWEITLMLGYCEVVQTLVLAHFNTLGTPIHFDEYLTPKYNRGHEGEYEFVRGRVMDFEDRLEDHADLVFACDKYDKPLTERRLSGEECYYVERLYHIYSYLYKALLDDGNVCQNRLARLHLPDYREYVNSKRKYYRKKFLRDNIQLDPQEFHFDYGADRMIRKFEPWQSPIRSWPKKNEDIKIETGELDDHEIHAVVKVRFYISAALLAYEPVTERSGKIKTAILTKENKKLQKILQPYQHLFLEHFKAIGITDVGYYPKIAACHRYCPPYYWLETEYVPPPPPYRSPSYEMWSEQLTLDRNEAYRKYQAVINAQPKPRQPPKPVLMPFGRKYQPKY
eukprot:GHVH01003573.1.p1 GENE.GHVH01003573.1~~GHVH01003573.1.p1  ORF type:complete len:390 (-),score=37.42 GHVH01003573.1:70-1239(-)